MLAIYWTQYFLKAQRYRILDNVLFQYNTSSILLEKNGKASSSKRTKHIKIRYFFITDRISQVDVSLVWCPTGDIIGDFMTKPLQGALFRKFRDQIMGVIPAQDPGPGKSQPGKSQTVKAQPEKSQAKERQGIIFLRLVLTVGQHHSSVLGEVKNRRNGQTHTHAIFLSCTYTRSSFVWPMAALEFTS